METAKNAAVRAPPALNPEQLALTQPWKDFVSRGVIASIVATFTPGGTSLGIQLGSQVPIPDGMDRTNVPPGLAKQIILDSGLIPAKGKKGAGGKDKGETLPSKTLCVKDVGLSPDEFGARIKAVAAKMGPSTAMGRIGSMKLNSNGAKDFTEWWSTADPAHKAVLVMDKKHYEALSPENIVELHSKLGAVGSPFRGPLPKPSLDNAEKKEDSQQAETTATPVSGEAAASAPKKVSVPQKGTKTIKK